jgi:hypothetical protein
MLNASDHGVGESGWRHDGTYVTQRIGSWGVALTGWATAFALGLSDMAATNLFAGDAALITYNADDDSIVILFRKAVTAGTTIYITDRAWNGSAFVNAAGDGTISITVGPGDFAAGLAVRFTAAQLASGGIDLSDLGETLYVYQGSDADHPTSFLFALDIGDGNSTFDGSLAGTGLTAGLHTAAIGADNASFGTRLANIQAQDLNAQIGNSDDWDQNDSSPQPLVPTFAFLTDPTDRQLFVAGAGGGDAIVTVEADNEPILGDVATRILHALQGDPAAPDSDHLYSPRDITLDTVHDRFFFVDSDGAGHNRIVQGSISDLLANPGAPLDLVILYENSGSGSPNTIHSLSVDTASGKIYFDVGTTFNRIDYDGAGQSPTQLADLSILYGASSYITQVAIDYAAGIVFLGSSVVASASGVDTIQTNRVFTAAGLAASLTGNVLVFAPVPFTDNDTTIMGEGSSLGVDHWPVERGAITGIDVDPVTHIVYIATRTVVLDNDSDGSTIRYGGIWSYDPAGGGAVTNLYTQDGSSGPLGRLSYIEVDPVTGRYYVSDSTGGPAVGDGGVWIGSMTLAGTPALFATVGNNAGLAPMGLEIQHAPTLTGSVANTFQIETAGNPSPDPTAVQPASGFTANDADSGGDPNGDALAGAQIRISSGFLSGAGHQDILSILGTQSGTLTFGNGDTADFSYDPAAGVMTLTGVTTLANYQSVFDFIRFQATGDDPTANGTDISRTIAYSVFDGLLYSNEVLATVIVIGVNDAPVLAGFEPSVTFAENLVNATPQLLDSDVVFTDAEGNFNLGTLTVSGLLAEDRLGVDDEGSDPGEIGVSGSNISYGGTIIGSFAGGVGNTFTVTFNAAASSEAVDALIEHLTYSNISHTPTASRLLTLTVTDAAGADLVTMPTFAELAAAANPFAGANLGDDAKPSFVDLDGDGDLDAVVGSGGGGYYGQLRSFENVGDGTDADSFDDFIELSPAANPFDGLQFSLVAAPTFVDLDHDGDLDAVVGDGNLNRVRMFENVGDGADAGSFDEFVERTGSANPFAGLFPHAFGAPSFLDVDGDGDLDAVIGNAEGRLVVLENVGDDSDADVFDDFVALAPGANPFNGLDVGDFAAPSAVDLDGDGDMDLVIGNVLGALRSFRNDGSIFTELTGAENPFDGVDIGAQAGPGFADLDGDGDPDAIVGILQGALAFENEGPRSETILVNVTAQNDPPANSVPAATQTIDEGGALLFSTAEGNRINVSDLDAGSGELSVTLAIADGILTLGDTSGLSAFTQGTNDIQLTGTIAALNAALDGLIYTPPVDANGNRTLTVTTNDNGNSGGPAEEDVDTVAIAITAINDEPAGANADRTIFEDATYTFAAVDFGFTDPADSHGLASVLITTTVTTGLLQWDSDANPSTAPVIVGDGDEIPVADIDAGRLAYTPLLNQSGDNYASFTFQVRDDGGTPGVDLDQSPNSFTFNVTAVNDPPVNTTAPFFPSEDAIAIPVTGYSISDADADPATDIFTVTLTVAHGVLNLATTGIAGGVGAGQVGGNGTASITVNATLNAINATLADPAGLAYTPDRDYYGSETLALASNDNGATGPDGAKTSTISVVVTVAADIDIADDSATTDENVAVAIHVLDNDAFEATPAISATTDGAHGLVAIHDNGTGDTTDDYVVYTPDTDFNGPDSFTYTVTSGGVTETATVNVNVGPVNDPPVLAGLEPNVTFLENGVNFAPELLDADVDFQDVEGNFTCGTLTVTGLLLEDLVEVRNQGTAAGEIGVSGTDVTYGGIVIGTVTGGDGETLTIIFNSAATSAAVDALIQNLTYANLSDAPKTSRALYLNVTDADGADLGIFTPPGVPHFAQVDAADNPFDGFLAYGAAAPVFVDLDGDFDLDLVVGDALGFLSAFENDGGVFTQLCNCDNPFDALLVDYLAKPVFVNLDGDGDLDLVVGGAAGLLQYFRNDDGVFTELTGADNPFGGVSVDGYFAAPAFVDLDGDLDLDLVVGDGDGLLSAFRNEGGIFTELTGTDNPFQGLAFGPIATPVFVDVDGDGDLDLVVGDYQGGMRLFVRGPGGSYEEVTGADNPFNAISVYGFSAPAFVDLDGDGDLDAVVGDYYGALTVFENAPAHGQRILVDVTPENDPLLLDLDDSAPGFDASAAYTEGDAPVAIAPAAIFFDPDLPDDYGGFIVTVELVANGGPDDVLAIDNVGTGSGEIGVSGSDLLYEGVVVGGFTGGANGDPLVITFNGAACDCAVQSAIANIIFSITTPDPAELQRIATFTVTDPGGDIASAQAIIDVTAIEVPAVAVDDAGAVDENAVLNGSVLADNGNGADSDFDGPLPLTIEEVNGVAGDVGTEITLPSGAKLKLNADGTYSYNPNGKFNTLTNPSSGETGAVNISATDSFTYKLAGGNTATVTITVNGVVSPQDRLEGDGTNNVITGTPGPDFFFVIQGGNDDLSGLGGNDVFLFGAALTSADKVDGGPGQDQIAIQGNYAGLTLGNQVVSVESLAILPGNDTRFGDVAGNFYDYNITTVDANVAAGAQLVVDANRLRVGEDFTFNGSAETDGSFFIFGGGGTDNLTGGAKNDVFYFGESGQFGASDTANGGSGGTDQLGLRGNYTIVFGATQLVSIESIGLVSAHDTRFGPLGVNYNYDLTMDDGNVAAGQQMTVDAAPLRSTETLTFNGAAELDGTFRVFGGAGNDSITGSQGNDLITGGAGADSLTGGAGNDSFIYRTLADSTSASHDTIQDFMTGDRIDLSRIDANSGTAGDDAFAFIGAGAFTHHAGELRATNVGSTWTVQGDVDGDGIADIELVVIVGDAHPLGGGDFAL